MKIHINRTLHLSMPTSDVEDFVARVRNFSVHSRVYGRGDGEHQTVSISEQKITLDEEAMAELIQLFDGASDHPLCLEYCGYAFDFELYKKF